MEVLKLNVLYVDDEVENLFTFKSMFRREFSISVAKNAMEAKELIREQSFDVVLSDQRMPNMTGLELCTFLSQNYPDIRRYIVTGHSEMEPLHKAIDEGVIKSVIKKPWEMSALKSLILA